MKDFKPFIHRCKDIWAYIGHLANTPSHTSPKQSDIALHNRWASHFSAQQVHKIGLNPHTLASHAIEMTARGMAPLEVLNDIDYRIMMAKLSIFN